MMNFLFGFVAGWIVSSIVSTFTATFVQYRNQSSALQDLLSELEIIKELVGEKLEEADGELLESYELVLPNSSYRGIVENGMNIYISERAAKLLGQTYSVVNALNDLFESGEQGDPYRTFSLVKNVDESCGGALESIRKDLEDGVYSSYFRFLRFQLPV